MQSLFCVYHPKTCSIECHKKLIRQIKTYRKTAKSSLKPVEMEDFGSQVEFEMEMGQF